MIAAELVSMMAAAERCGACAITTLSRRFSLAHLPPKQRALPRLMCPQIAAIQGEGHS